MPENQSTQEELSNDPAPLVDAVEEWHQEFVFKPSGRHVYKQQGYYLVCNSCDLQHAIFIGSDKVMVGEDEAGQPILKKRQDL